MTPSACHLTQSDPEVAAAISQEVRLQLPDTLELFGTVQCRPQGHGFHCLASAQAQLVSQHAINGVGRDREPIFKQLHRQLSRRTVRPQSPWFDGRTRRMYFDPFAQRIDNLRLCYASAVSSEVVSRFGQAARRGACLRDGGSIEISRSPFLHVR